MQNEINVLNFLVSYFRQKWVKEFEVMTERQERWGCERVMGPWWGFVNLEEIAA